MSTRIFLLLALALPLAACADDAEVADADTTVVTPEPIEPPMEPMEPAPATDGVTAQATVDAVQQAGGLTSLTVAAATQNIDGWIAQLEGNPDFASVVTDLRTLRGQLQASPIDGAAVGGTLQRLGEATTAAAAGDGALETLGTTLTEAGNQLAGAM